jgi:hypothetical protein
LYRERFLYCNCELGTGQWDVFFRIDQKSK